MKRSFLAGIVVSSLLTGSGAQGATPPPDAVEVKPAAWVVKVPEIASDPEQWKRLVRILVNSGMDYAAWAAARRMAIYFEDVDSKEFAFSSLIELADRVWPFNLRPYFVPGDLDVRGGENWVASYNLYKALINEDAGMHRWAQEYYSRFDRGKSLKYLFHKGLRLYAEGKKDEALEELRKVLGSPNLGNADKLLAMKVARSIARILYEKELYDDSLAIYDTFLLRLNPLVPSDYLEAAWNLYRQKNYPKALGYLYNLESRQSGRPFNIERYILRSAIYRDNCEADRMKALSRSFENDFGDVIRGIRTGQQLSSIGDLHRIEIPENAAYTERLKIMEGLKAESARSDDLPERVRGLAAFLFKTEISAQSDFLRLYRDDALSSAAEYVIKISESLKFMAFEVAREKFNPDDVFSQEERGRSKPSFTPKFGDSRIVIWRQFDDYWRDERMDYFVGIRNRCAE